MTNKLNEFIIFNIRITLATFENGEQESLQAKQQRQPKRQRFN